MPDRVNIRSNLDVRGGAERKYPSVLRDVPDGHKREVSHFVDLRDEP
jgi:hypothetical protein